MLEFRLNNDLSFEEFPLQVVWNLERWDEMLKGDYKEEEAVVRLKTNIIDPNPAFRDRVLARIVERKHPRVGKEYRVWPLLEASWALDDYLLGVTHIIRGKELMIEGMMEYVGLRQIVTPSPEILAGATGPVTLAGMMTQHNAEVLSMITLTQLISPGTPVLYGTVSTVMDMKTSMARLGSPELGITHMGFAQLAKWYNLPCRGAAGNSDSKSLDAQAGYEAAFNLVLATCAGFNFITYALGGLDFSNSVSY
jgi:hypothetical protein